MNDEWEMTCPNCLSGDSLDVQAHVMVRLVGNGTDADESADGSHEWDSKSKCLCAACHWSGTVAETEAAYKALTAQAEAMEDAGRVVLSPVVADDAARIMDSLLQRGDLIATPSVDAFTEAMNALYALGNDTGSIVCETLKITTEEGARA